VTRFLFHFKDTPVGRTSPPTVSVPRDIKSVEALGGSARSMRPVKGHLGRSFKERKGILEIGRALLVAGTEIGTSLSRRWRRSPLHPLHVQSGDSLLL